MDVIRSRGIIGGPYLDVPAPAPVDLVFCNPDLLWKSDFPQVRLGQGAFREAFQAVHKVRVASRSRMGMRDTDTCDHRPSWGRRTRTRSSANRRPRRTSSPSGCCGTVSKSAPGAGRRCLVCQSARAVLHLDSTVLIHLPSPRRYMVGGTSHTPNRDCPLICWPGVPRQSRVGYACSGCRYGARDC